MVWNFLKSKFKNIGDGKEPAKTRAEESVPAVKPAAPEAATPAPVRPPAVPAENKTPEADKSDEELAADIDKISPGILAQAKNPQARKLIIDVYRKMLREGVNVKSEKEVGKWIKKHPEALEGGEVRKVETFKREQPKIGRNDSCSCGSGKKYKKCCGKNG